MALRLAELQDRFRAAFLGFAVGDALGFPYRGLPPASAARGLSLADDFAARPRGRFAKGQFSDDTQVMLAVGESIATARRIEGRGAAAHVAALWQEGVILLPPPSTTSAAEALLAGTPWMSAGAELGVRDASCLSRGVVLGLWCDDSPVKLAHDASVLTVLTHKDPVCAAAAAAVARAVQLGLSGETLEPGAFCEELSRAARGCDADLADEIFYLPRVLGWDADRALTALRRIAVPGAQLETEPGIPAHVTPVLLCAVYAALKVPHDLRAALNLLLRCGGEVDVAAGVCGAILGSALGTMGLPARLKKNLLYAEEVTGAADRLFDARLAREPVRQPVVAASKR